MDQNKFRDTLLSYRTRTYCVLDGASVPDLPKRLYEFDPPNYSLMPGELTPDMVHVAPYVVIMAPDGDFTKWILENGFGKNWGIFVQTRFSITEMRKHFRGLFTVHDETGKPMMFRFYDPRVIRKFLPTCDGDQVQTFFGKIDKFFVESGEGETLIAYSQENGALKETEIELGKNE